MELLLVIILILTPYIEKLMEIMPLENKKLEIINGNLIHKNIDLVLVKKEFKMEQHQQFIMKGMKKHIHKQSLFKKQQKTLGQLLQIFQDNQKILVKDRLTEDKILHMVLKICKEKIHGTHQDVFMVNHSHMKFNRIKIQENL